MDFFPGPVFDASWSSLLFALEDLRLRAKFDVPAGVLAVRLGALNPEPCALELRSFGHCKCRFRRVPGFHSSRHPMSRRPNSALGAPEPGSAAIRRLRPRDTGPAFWQQADVIEQNKRHNYKEQ